jgi:hypothetical protein
MRLTLEIEWVPGNRIKWFGEMCRVLCETNPASIEAAIPAIEQNGFVAKIDAAGEDLSIHAISSFGEVLPSRVAVLHSRARTPIAELRHQVAPYMQENFEG